IFLWDDLPGILKSVLPQHYTYQIQNLTDLPLHRTLEDFEVANFELDTFVNIDSEEVTNLMARVHKKVIQAGEICYMDASALFNSLNTSITIFYTSCAVGALPLGLFITSDESEKVGPIVFLTDDSSVECNALELC
ncbi:28718_t:CDS:2, partial [Dentiscutata erythropus]